MVTSRKKLDFWFWVKVVVIGFMLIFLIYPFCTLITRSFFSNKTAGFTFENYIRFFTKKYFCICGNNDHHTGCRCAYCLCNVPL